MSDKLKIFVDLDWNGTIHNVGTLLFNRQRGAEVMSFAYTEAWLSSSIAYEIDPELPLISGHQYPSSSNFGCFSDSAPDRWGKTLIQRAWAKEGKTRSSLYESDYLLGVMDILRMGAFRFREHETYLSDRLNGIPKLKNINEFYHTIENILKGGETADRDLLDVLGPGSSLGGARPKLTLFDDKGQLFIVKFPNIKHDTIDVPLWEKVCLDLAEMCGLNVPSSTLKELPCGKHALIIKRFDREGDKRIPFASAMTLLSAKDSDASGLYSYLDIAEIIASNGRNTDKSLTELWKRMQFNVLISNRDDHLRNHGFLRGNLGWELSPVYDLETDATSPCHSLSLNASGDCEPDPSLAISSAQYFGIKESEALSLTKEMCSIVEKYPNIAKKYGASGQEIKAMQQNFIVQL